MIFEAISLPANASGAARRCLFSDRTEISRAVGSRDIVYISIAGPPLPPSDGGGRKGRGDAFGLVVTTVVVMVVMVSWEVCVGKDGRRTIVTAICRWLVITVRRLVPAMPAELMVVVSAVVMPVVPMLDSLRRTRYGV